MMAEKNRSYEKAAQDYLVLFDQLLEMPEQVGHAPRRGAADVPAEVIVARAEKIVDVSAGMVPLARDLLESPDLAIRQGISGQLVTQAAAELQLATEMLQIAGDEDLPPSPATRAARGSALHDAITALETAMKTPLSQGLGPLGQHRRTSVSTPATLDAAKKSLKTSATTSTGAITQHVCEFGGDIAWDLVFKTEWVAVINGTTLLHKDIAEKLDTVKKGASEMISRALTTATKTLLNVFDKIMAILGKDVQDQARQKIKKWLEKIKADGKIDLFDQLVDKLYGVDHFEKELDGWLSNTPAQTKVLQDTASAVSSISDQFIILIGRMKLLEQAANLAKLIKIPQVLLVVTGVQIALLAVLVYAGFDFIGYKEPPYPNITRGVAEVIQENLAE